MFHIIGKLINYSFLNHIRNIALSMYSKSFWNKLVKGKREEIREGGRKNENERTKREGKREKGGRGGREKERKNY